MAMSKSQRQHLIEQGQEFMGHISYEAGWEPVQDHMNALRADSKFEFIVHEPLPGQFLGSTYHYSVWRKKKRTRTTNVHE